MSEQPKKRRSPIKITITLVIVLMLYVVSVGPVNWLDEHGYFQNTPEWLFSTTQAIYTPLVWIVEKTGLMPVLEWYLELWRA